MMQRILGLDIGTNTIGLAMSDPLGITAQGLHTLRRKTLEEDMEALLTLIKEYEVALLVVGLPKNMNNTLGPSAIYAQEFANHLTEQSGIPHEFIDERLTTVSANRAMLEGDLSRKKRKKIVDTIAAVIILQNYLDRKSR